MDFSANFVFFFFSQVCVSIVPLRSSISIEAVRFEIRLRDEICSFLLLTQCLQSSEEEGHLMENHVSVVDSGGRVEKSVNSVGEERLRVKGKYLGVDLDESDGLMDSVCHKRPAETTTVNIVENDCTGVVEEKIAGDLSEEGVENLVSLEAERLGQNDDMVVDSMESVGEKGLEKNDVVGSKAVKEKRLVENNVAVDSVSSKALESVGEKKLGEASMVVDTVDSIVVELVGEERLEESKMGLDSVGFRNVEGNSDEKLKENNAVVDSVGSKVVESVGEKRLEENSMVIDLVGSTRVESDGEKRLKENNVVVDSVGSKVVESIDEKHLGETNVVVDSVEEKRGGDLNGKGGESLTPLVGKKRAAENSIDDNLGGNKNKKARIDVSKDMKRVAEIVLVLSGMGNMRGGRSPTAAEKEIMAEAREKLVGLCEGMAPKDIAPRDAVRVVIEDLGLSRSRDQRMVFRPPVMSIKDKLQLNQRKMEESKKFALPSGAYSSQTQQAGFGAKNETHGTVIHTTTPRFPPDRSGQITVSAGGSATPLSNNHANGVQSTIVSRGPFTNPSERNASSLPLPRTEAAHFRLDERQNISVHSSQVRANSSGDHLLGRTPTCSPHTQLGAVARVGLANKVPDHKVEGTPGMGVPHVDRNSNPSVAQPAYVNLQAVQKPLPGLNFVQASNHNEIGRIVQKFLHPRLPELSSWTPPSTDYMNKSLTCQACKFPVNDVESLLVCDACEKGNHIKCLQSYNQKGVPKGEWHCPTCLIASNGKPLPPKYGRVTRSGGAPKVSSNTAKIQASAEKVGSLDQKVNHQKAAANGDSGSGRPSQVGHAGNTRIEIAADPKVLQAANSIVNKVKIDGATPSEPKSLPKDTIMLPSALFPQKPNESSKSFGPSSFKPDVSVSNPKILQKCESGESCLNKASEAAIDTRQCSQNLQDVGKVMQSKSAEVPLDQYNIKLPDSRDTTECNPGFDVRKDGQDAAQAVSVGNIGVGNGARDCSKSSLDGLHIVDWVGNILKNEGEKARYTSCRINGVVYKLQDHALFRSNNGDLRPSKIQELWEDTKTGSKLAKVNSCYFPSDLPEVVGRPCSPENNEVYESNHGSTVRAGLVQGPCEVLPPNKFKEEHERPKHSNGTQPVFLCKWFYDESKGLFRHVTD